MNRKRQTNNIVNDDDDEENIFTIKKSPKERKIVNDSNSNNENNKNCRSLKMTLRRSTEKSSYKAFSDSTSLLSSISLSNKYSHTEEINKEKLEYNYLRSNTLAEKKLQQFLKTTENDKNDKVDQEFDESDNQNESDDSYVPDIDNNLELITNRKCKIVSKKPIQLPVKKKKTKISDSQETPSTRLRFRKTTLSTTKSVASKPAIPSIKIRTLTPSIKRRTADVAKPKTILEEARAQLHVSAVPKSLPCREIEFNDIFMFLKKKIADYSSGCMYISGVPGTGKTATVNEVIRCLKKLNSKGSLPDFDLFEINGMKLSEPRQSYVQIVKQMTGQSVTWEEAFKILDKRFTNNKTKKFMTLLLIDELDVLCNKRQDVVYNLLNWPSQPAAQLVVITIANTMDLPERVLMSRVTSRLGLTRLTFQPYNYKQLNEIVITRLNESNAFKSEAVQLVARKVAAISGDARRALDICRRATEIAELYESKIVSLQHVNEALTEMIANVKVRVIKHCSEMEKIFLQAVCAEITRTGVEETTFINVYKQLEALCSFEGVPAPTVTQGLDICNRLCTNRLILCDDPRSDILQKIFLNVSSDDIHFALQDINI